MHASLELTHVYVASKWIYIIDVYVPNHVYYMVSGYIVPFCMFNLKKKNPCLMWFFYKKKCYIYVYVVWFFIC
jgi:hypothetical protein